LACAENKLKSQFHYVNPVAAEEDSSMEVIARSDTQPVNHAFPNYDCGIIELEGWKQFRRCLGERARCFHDDANLQYVAVKNVSTDDLEYIDNLRSRGELPQMRILYDEEKRLIIAKFMSGAPHEVASMLFNDQFREKVPLSAGILGVGSTRFGRATQRCKEADQSYLPDDTRSPDRDWPSVVVEVCVSESLIKLREDASYWLTRSGGRVFVVIIISIDLSTGDVIWGWWEHMTRAIGPTTRRQSAMIYPTLMQTITLPAVTGAPFLIPRNKIWDCTQSCWT
jgi:hypothetical protein